MIRTILSCVAAAATILTANPAGAADCGANVHIVNIENRGFFPDKQYFCPGQVVYFKNRTSSYISFYYKDSYGRNTWTNYIRSGQYFGPLSNATPIFSGKSTQRYAPDLWDAELIQGIAPDS